MLSTQIEANVVLDFILSRRTCYQFLDKTTSPVKAEKIDLCIKAAISAPNHKLTQPWHFYVVGNEFTIKFADIYADNRASKNSLLDKNCYDNFYTKAITKFLAIPKIVMVVQNLVEDEVICQEDYAGCSCAIQNFQLMAWSMNMGVQWSTGPIINDLRSYQLLNLDPTKQRIIGALYMGNIDENCIPKSKAKRKSVNEVTDYLA